MNPVEAFEILEGFEGLLFEMAGFYTFIISVILLIAIYQLYSICQNEISEYKLLKLSTYFFVTSPIVYSLSSSTIDALQSYELAYIQSKFYAQYGEASFQSFDWGSLMSKSWQVSRSIDFSLIYKIYLYSGANIVFKYLIPAILAALGAWSLARFLDHRVKISKST